MAKVSDFHIQQEPKKNDDKSELCGIGRFKPKFLQSFHTPTWLTVCISICILGQGMDVNGLLSVSLTTIEKRFGLTSLQLGSINTAYNFGALLAIIPVGYYGQKARKGRWICFGMMAVGLGSFIFTLPHFLYSPEVPVALGKYQNDTISENQICGQNIDPKMKNHSSLIYYIIMLFAKFIQGVGSVTLHNLAIAYIDENATQRSSAMYLVACHICNFLASLFGFVIGGSFLRMDGNIGRESVKQISYGVNDVRWYGNWWFGFLIAGTLSFIGAVPLLCFAKKLPGYHERRSHDIVQSHQAFKGYKKTGKIHKDLFSFAKILLTNTSNLFRILENLISIWMFAGFSNFLTKFFEVMFSVHAFVASYIVGLVVLPSCLIGVILGAYIVKRWYLTVPSMFKMQLIFQLATLLLAPLFLIRCPPPEIAGVDVAYVGDLKNESIDVISSCNINCNCTSEYRPVCDIESEISFYSPCHAGCADLDRTENITTFSNCSCSGNKKIVDGICPKLCKTQMIAFLTLFAVANICIWANLAPKQQIALRFVPFEMRTLEIAISFVIFRFSGVTTTIIFGWIFDSTCTHWKKNISGDEYCLRYDMIAFADFLLYTGVGLNIAAMICTFLALKFYKK